MRHVLRRPPPLCPPDPRGRLDRPGAAGAGQGEQGVAQGLANLAWVGGAHTGKMFVVRVARLTRPKYRPLEVLISPENVLYYIS